MAPPRIPLVVVLLAGAGHLVSGDNSTFLNKAKGALADAGQAIETFLCNTSFGELRGRGCTTSHRTKLDLTAPRDRNTLLQYDMRTRPKRA